MNSLQRKRRMGRLTVLAALALLFALIALSALRPSPEEEREDDFVETVLAREGGRLKPAERDELRRQWEQFSPESRKRVFFAVARERLEELRQETKELTAEQRAAEIQKAVAAMRRRRERVSATDRDRLRARVTSQEGKELVQHFLTFYQSELTASERAEADPLVHEWLYQIEDLMRQ